MKAKPTKPILRAIDGEIAAALKGGLKPLLAVFLWDRPALDAFDVRARRSAAARHAGRGGHLADGSHHWLERRHPSRLNFRACAKKHLIRLGSFAVTRRRRERRSELEPR
jgi:hypothetical protein